MNNYLKNLQPRLFYSLFTAIVLTCSFLSTNNPALANPTISPTTNATTLSNRLRGANVNITNLTVTGNTGGVGTFTGGATSATPGPTIGIADGIVLYSGTVNNVRGPNNSASSTSGSNTPRSDGDLSQLLGTSELLYDTIVIEFDITPIYGNINLRFVFGSEEYPEYVCTRFNDIFGFFFSGPGISGTYSRSAVNIAQLANGDRISINTINGGQSGNEANSGNSAPCTLNNNGFYVNNSGSSSTGGDITIATTNTNTQLDGFTVPLVAQLPTQPGQTYHVKMVLADVGDNAWDSGLFLDFLSSEALDYGDAPNSYGTSENIINGISLSNPAKHVITNPTNPNLTIGNSVDLDNDGAPSTAANGDDNDTDAPFNGDDEDGITSFPTLLTGSSNYSVNVNVRNTTRQTAYLVGWIDFNQSGTFESNESTYIPVPNNTNPGTVALTWNSLPGILAGTTYARFRLTTDFNSATNTPLDPDGDGNPNPTGKASNGEVEDYQLTVIQSMPKLLLVKRITAIDGVPINSFEDLSDPSNPKAPDDNNSNWPNPNTTYLRGAINKNNIPPDAEVEYTIYFLSTGDLNATDVTICDLVPKEMTFNSSGYAVNRGIAMGFDTTTLADPNNPNSLLTNILGDDRGAFYQPGTQPPTACKNPSELIPTTPLSIADNKSGVVVVNVVKSPDFLPYSLNSGNPPNSYGFIRFKAKVK